MLACLTYPPYPMKLIDFPRIIKGFPGKTHFNYIEVYNAPGVNRRSVLNRTPLRFFHYTIICLKQNIFSIFSKSLI